MTLPIITAILPIFILIGIGIVLQKMLPRQPKSSQLLCHIGLGSCETWTTVLNKYALYLALPALIFSSLAQASTENLLPATLILFTTLLLIASIIVTYTVCTLFKASPTLRNTYIFGVFFGNIAFIGPPFILSLYGTEVLGSLSIIIAIHIAVAFSLGLLILERSKHHNHIDWHTIITTLIKNPLLLSVISGLLILLSGISLPTSITTAISMLGASASPVVLVAMGTFIATEWHPRGHIGHTIAISLLKLMGLPLLFLIIGVSLFTPTILRDISILEAAMPVAISNFALAEIYPMDKKITANAIILSTILAVVTLSVFSLVLM